MSKLQDKLRALANGVSGKTEIVHDGKIYTYELWLVVDDAISELSPGDFGFMAWTEGLKLYGLPKYGLAVDSINNPPNLPDLSDEIQQKIQDDEHQNELAQALKMVKYLVDGIESKVTKSVKSL